MSCAGQSAALSAGGDGGLSFRIEELTEGGSYPADNPVVRIFDLDVEGGTLSWELIELRRGDYDMAAVVMKGGPDAMVYFYDSAEQRARRLRRGHHDADQHERRGGRSSVRDQPRGLLLRPEGERRPEGPRRQRRRPQASWEKIYTWDVEKSVDKPTLALSQGGSAR